MRPQGQFGNHLHCTLARLARRSGPHAPQNPNRSLELLHFVVQLPPRLLHGDVVALKELQLLAQPDLRHSKRAAVGAVRVPVVRPAATPCAQSANGTHGVAARRGGEELGLVER